MTDLEAVTIKNLLEDCLPRVLLASVCVRLSGASETHTFRVERTPEGVFVVVVERQATSQPG
jgi:hypothetical protein